MYSRRIYPTNPQPVKVEVEVEEFVDEAYHPHYDQEYFRNGVDPIFGTTESEFLGDVGDK